MLFSSHVPEHSVALPRVVHVFLDESVAEVSALPHCLPVLFNSHVPEQIGSAPRVLQTFFDESVAEFSVIPQCLPPPAIPQAGQLFEPFLATVKVKVSCLDAGVIPTVSD